MDDSDERRPLADNPDFLSSLTMLDDNLADFSPAVSGPPMREAVLPPRPAQAHRTPPERFTEVPTRDRSASQPSGGLGDARPSSPHPEPSIPPRSVWPQDGPSTPATYEVFYGLDEKPFGATSDLRFLFPSASYERTMQDLVTALDRRDGLITLVGTQGVGKTLLCRSLVERLDHRTLTSVVSKPRVSVEDLLKKILIDFGVISDDNLTRTALAQAPLQELMTALQEFLWSLSSIGASVIVFIDQAHELTADALEQICAILAIADEQRSIQFVLVGRPGLKTLLGRPQLRRVRERVGFECHLMGLEASELDGYIGHRVGVAGNARVEFGEDALPIIQRLSGGIPRLVNAICDRSLGLGFDASAAVIDAKLVYWAAVSLKMVPAASGARKVIQQMVAAGALAALAVFGATLSAMVFQRQFQQAVAHWESQPSLPSPPFHGQPDPLVPVTPIFDEPTIANDDGVVAAEPDEADLEEEQTDARDQ